MLWKRWINVTWISLTSGLAVLLGVSGTMAGTRTIQTNWTGGPGEAGPVIMWSDRFEDGNSVAWRSIAGQVALSSVPRATPIPEAVAQRGAVRPVTVAVADVDGDGRDDIVGQQSVTNLSPRQGSIYWWGRRPDGGWVRTTVTVDFYGAHYVNTADMDGDGDMDILGAAYFGDGPELGRNGKFAWFENLRGDGLSWRRHLVGDDFWGANWIDAGDFDGDGDMDLVGGSELTDGIYEQDADVALFVNVDGAGTAWWLVSLDDDHPNVSEVHAEDLDLDGDLDVVVANSAPVGFSQFHWYENGGSGMSWTKHAIPGEFRGSGYLDVGDVDGDGDPDLIGSGYLSGSVGFWENLAGDASSWQAWHATVLGNGRTIELADIDGDGDLDAVAAAGSPVDRASSALWLENTSGNGYFWDKHMMVEELDSQPWAAAGDLNSDGKLDAVVSNEDVYPPESFGVAWFDLTEFASLGDLTSAVLDGGRDPAWGVMTWDADVPEGASLTVQVRASKSVQNLGPFVTVPYSGADISTEINQDARYLQYRVVLDSGSSARSPQVRRIAVNALSLAGPEPGTAEETNSLTATGAKPGERVWFAYGMSTGSSGVPGCPEALSGLYAPSLVGSATADEGGIAMVEFLVPEAAVGQTVLFQALERESCTLSNWRAVTFQ